MRSVLGFTGLLVAAFGLSACGEYDQSLSSKRNAEKPWQGAKNEFVAKGWTPGDQNSWALHMRTRNQSQNEYNKTN